MTDATTHTPEPDVNFEAAEYALGLSEGEALSAARDRVLRDRDFAQLVAGWQERLVQLTEDIAPKKPPRRVKRAVMAQIFSKRSRAPLMQRLWVWQGVALASLFLAAWLAMPMLRPPAPDAPGGASGPIYSATMTGDTQEWQVFAVLDPARLGIALRRVSGEPPEGRVLELWAILPDTVPVSLGVVPEDGDHLPLPPELADRLDSLTLAISDEPPGGAPGGTRTGAILAVGAVSKI